MRNSQASTLLFVALALALFFFSLTLLPAVELYCRFRRPAIVLLALQMGLVVLRTRPRAVSPERALVIATYVFASLGIAFNAALLVMARNRC
jgi:hypothetical protein